jgi:general secretion pathway protein E
MLDLVLKETNNLSLTPVETNSNDQFLEHNILLSEYNGKVNLCISTKHLAESLEYISKTNFDNLEILLLDNESYTALYKKTLEQQKEKEFINFETAKESDTEYESDLKLAEFLRNSADILTSEESAPIIKFVNSVFYQAVKKRASDIHIQTYELKGEIKYRINGILTHHIELDRNIINLVVNRIKVISNLDISEKRIPQDGRTQIKVASKNLDIRVSVMPTYYGERITLRLLTESDEVPSLELLGFNKDMITKIRKTITKPYGILLVTGPTGSGKSTTLHSILQEVISDEKNIITIEDPVEYKSNKISQIQVNSKVGLTFANGLKSILRQDPDIIMVGEIRDSETAKIAIQSALTGHLVFSTLHTNNSILAVERLLDMGIEKFLITSSLLGIIAQRLVRVLCNECKTIDNDSESIKTELGLSQDAIIYKANGCGKCNSSGYTHRMAVGEFFTIDDDVINILRQDYTKDELQRFLMDKKDFIPFEDGIKKLLQDGKTSIAEAIRIGF